MDFEESYDDLERFLSAQNGYGDVYLQALREVTSGKKTSHWIWFVFPMLRGIGASSMSRHYGIAGLDEAVAYLENETLRKRLIAITEEAAKHFHRGVPPVEIFGEVDAKKVRSCLTLFAIAAKRAEGNAARDVAEVFAEALKAGYDGVPCEKTERMLGVRLRDCFDKAAHCETDS